MISDQDFIGVSLSLGVRFRSIGVFLLFGSEESGAETILDWFDNVVEAVDPKFRLSHEVRITCFSHTIGSVIF